MNKKDLIEKLQGIIEELEAEEEIKTELKRGDIIECTHTIFIKISGVSAKLTIYSRNNFLRRFCLIF